MYNKIDIITDYDYRDYQCKSIKTGDLFKLSSYHCNPLLALSLEDAKVTDIGTFKCTIQISIKIYLIGETKKNNPFVSHDLKQRGHYIQFYSYNGLLESPIMIEVICKSDVKNVTEYKL